MAPHSHLRGQHPIGAASGDAALQALRDDVATLQRLHSKLLSELAKSTKVVAAKVVHVGSLIMAGPKAKAEQALAELQASHDVLDRGSMVHACTIDANC